MQVALVSRTNNMNELTTSRKLLRRSQQAKYIFLFTISLVILQAVKTEEYGTIAGKWQVKYGKEDTLSELRLQISQRAVVPLTIYDVDNVGNDNEIYFEIQMDNSKLAKVERRIYITDFQNSQWQGDVTVEGLHFGYSLLYVTLKQPSTNRQERSVQSLDVVVVRDKHIDDNILTYTAAAIMLLMFVNLGTVMDLQRLKAIFSRPIGPLLGFCSRYIVMPGLALGLGALMFKDNKPLQLALFFSALAPSGGIANICNVFLRGNVNLSLATTTVNSILALGMLPLWIYLMGPVLYKDHTFDLPYVNLALGCVGLCVALIVGVTLRLCIPKTTQFIFRFLKPVSVILSLCLVALTVGINYYVFHEITLMIFLASLCLPALGYGLSFTLSKLFCRSATDSMTIAIETSVLNMSLPLVLLQYTLDQPMADMLIVVPVLASLVSLCLVLVFYIVRRIFGWNTKTDMDSFDEKAFLVLD